MATYAIRSRIHDVIKNKLCRAGCADATTTSDDNRSASAGVYRVDLFFGYRRVTHLPTCWFSLRCSLAGYEQPPPAGLRARRASVPTIGADLQFMPAVTCLPPPQYLTRRARLLQLGSPCSAGPTLFACRLA